MNNNNFFYSFKIFPQFWLAKSTRIIHHNQLLINKFRRILSLKRKWRQKCSPLQVKAPLPRRPGDEVELFWLWRKKWRTFHSFQLGVRTTAGTRRNNSSKHGKNSKKTTRTTAIWRIFVELDKPKRILSKMNLTLMQVSIFLLCFWTRNYFEWIIRQLMNSAFVGYEELSRSRRVLSSLPFGLGG